MPQQLAAGTGTQRCDALSSACSKLVRHSCMAVRVAPEGQALQRHRPILQVPQQARLPAVHRSLLNHPFILWNVHRQVTQGCQSIERWLRRPLLQPLHSLLLAFSSELVVRR